MDLQLDIQLYLALERKRFYSLSLLQNAGDGRVVIMGGASEQAKLDADIAIQEYMLAVTRNKVARLRKAPTDSCPPDEKNRRPPVVVPNVAASKFVPAGVQPARNAVVRDQPLAGSSHLFGGASPLPKPKTVPGRPYVHKPGSSNMSRLI